MKDDWNQADPISRWEREQRAMQRRDRIAQVIAWVGLILAAGFVVAVAYLFIVVVFASACSALA